MRDSLYQHFCTVLLGVATFFRFVAYDFSVFLVESLVHSAHVRDPTAIMNHAGYYGQALKEVASCVATFIVPLVLNYMKPKWGLVIGSGIFTLYVASFFYINNYLYFIANIFLGFSFTLNYTSFATYQMQFATRKTLARNAARVYGIACLSLIFGGCIYIYATQASSEVSESLELDTSYRYYSESETRIVCGALLISSLIALVIQAFMPNREVENSVTSENPHEKLTFGGQISAISSVLVHPNILMFIPRFWTHGLFFSYYMNVYPTSLQYSTILANKYPMLTAYYAFAMCAGTTIGGIIIAPLNKRYHDFGLRPLFYCTVVIQLITYTLAVLTVPNWSTARPTAESAFFEPSLLWVCVISFLSGSIDSASTASLAVVCTRLIPGRAAHTFAAARFYMGVISAVIFFCSPMLSMQAHGMILFGITILSGCTFDIAVKKFEQRDEKEKLNNLRY